MDEQTTEAPAPKPKRKYRKRTRAAILMEKEKASQASPYEGLTERNCCDACGTPKGCVITHDDICGHPMMGLQPAHAIKSDIVQRRREARIYLEKARSEKRFAQL